MQTPMTVQHKLHTIHAAQFGFLINEPEKEKKNKKNNFKVLKEHMVTTTIEFPLTLIYVCSIILFNI